MRPTSQPERSISSARKPFWKASLNVRPIAIASPTAFIWVPSLGSAVGELLEREARHFHHDVVQHRFERGRGRLGDVVRQLVQPVADGDLGADPRDGKSGVGGCASLDSFSLNSLFGAKEDDGLLTEQPADKLYNEGLTL